MVANIAAGDDSQTQVFFNACIYQGEGKLNVRERDQAARITYICTDIMMIRRHNEVYSIHSLLCLLSSQYSFGVS